MCKVKQEGSHIPMRANIYLIRIPGERLERMEAKKNMMRYVTKFSNSRSTNHRIKKA